MKEPFRRVLISATSAALALMVLAVPRLAGAGGVTIITHGYNSDANTWVAGMADRMRQYRVVDSNCPVYMLTFTYNGSGFLYQWSRTSGELPALAPSGEIFLKLDWGQMAGGWAPYNFTTHDIAFLTSWALLQTNLISELGGHALAEFPLHLIGHSRGGSLVCETSRQLGTNGVWVDHVTTLDPHPLNNDGNVDLFMPTDASAASTTLNVLFRDNYWQDMPGGFLDFNGEPASGAYNRYLANLAGGYNDSSLAAPYHSNVHLWYHGTLDFRNPASDTEALLTTAERQAWWTGYESYGVLAGFYYTLIGGGDRTSSDQPAGLGLDAIRDGYNQAWDLGAGTSANRTALPANNGNWPNLVKFNRTTTNQVVQGQTMPVKFYYQWARPNTSLATVSFYLDDDLNPLNTNHKLIRQLSVPGNGASYLSNVTTNLTLYASNAAPGYHAVLAKISGGGNTRYLYAPELVQVISIRQPPTLEIAKLGALQYRLGVTGIAGQTVVLQYSTNLSNWYPLATNTLTTGQWLYTNTPTASPPHRFYRGLLP